MPVSTASATDPVATEAAQRVLDDEGRAADGVIAGFLAAAGAHAEVLLSPTVAFVGGLGVGARLLDGRAVQPGLGAKRPRGYRPGDVVPEAAFAAAPRSLGLLALLHSYGARRPMSALIRPALTHARRARAEARRGLLERLSRRGATTLTAGEDGRRLLVAAGSVQGGALTASDLEHARPDDRAASFAPVADPLEAAVTPWPADEQPPRAQVIIAADVLGMVVALTYLPDPEGIEVEELGLRLPRNAEPVRRGVPRVQPGSPRPGASPVALLRKRSEGWFAAVGITGAKRIDVDALDSERPLADQLERLRGGAGPAIAATTQRRRTQLVRVGD